MVYTESGLAEIASKEGLTIEFAQGVIFIRTVASTWRLFHDYEKVTKVWHENYRTRMQQYTTRRKTNDGYHVQKIKGSFPDIFSYIARHDKKMLSGCH